MKRNIHVGYLLSQITKAYAQKQEEHFKARGITLSFKQYTIIATLAVMGPLSQKNLARFSGRDFTSCSRILNTLERDGYISREKNPKDKRGQIIKNTEKSNALYQEIISARNETTQVMFTGLEEREAEIKELLEQMLQNLHG